MLIEIRHVCGALVDQVTSLDAAAGHLSDPALEAYIVDLDPGVLAGVLAGCMQDGDVQRLAHRTIDPRLAAIVDWDYRRGHFRHGWLVPIDEWPRWVVP